MAARNDTVDTSEIRPFRELDTKDVRMLLGMSEMEQLATANSLTYTHVYTLGAWLTISAVVIQVMQWWPRYDVGFLGYLRPVPTIFALAVPFMFAIDWVHRPHFEKAVRARLSSEDVLEIPSYYSRSKYSTFLVLTWKRNPIGCIAIDAAGPDEVLTNAEDQDLLPTLAFIPGSKKVDAPKPKDKSKLPPKKPFTKTTATHAVVRHFQVDAAYHETNVQSDLVAQALDVTFARGESGKGSPIEKVLVRVSSLSPWALGVWRSMGFEDVSAGKVDVSKRRAFIAGERIWWMEIKREKWLAGQKA